MKKKSITAREFDEKFDNGEDISEFLDYDKIQKSGLSIKRVSVDFPEWMIKSLDNEAKRLGVIRQSVIKFWISEKLSNRTA